MPSEDLLVAMALSRSEMKQEAVPAVLRLGTAFSERTKLATGMCDHEWRCQARPYCCWLKGTAVPQGMWTTSFLTVSLLFLSREEESQEESSYFPTPVVSPGLGNYRETD